MIKNKTIFITGGAGFLGTHLVERYVKDNKIIIYSRDEAKHWKSKLYFRNNPNITYIIGDVANRDKVRQSLIRTNPHILILAAAMKHIDVCEIESDACILTNIIGTQNFLNEIEYNRSVLSNIETVIFVSTDKSCSPINIYGMCKAISEGLMVEKSRYIKDIKFSSIKYGNVVASSGSIIPVLHENGKNPAVKEFSLTSSKMTRFFMSVDQSVDLIEHTILNADSGDIVIPKLISFRIIDLFEIFSEIYKKPIKITKLRAGEKLLESLINETQSMRLVFHESGYMHIKPDYYTEDISDHDFVKDYNSKLNPLSKEELKHFLTELKLI